MDLGKISGSAVVVAALALPAIATSAGHAPTLACKRANGSVVLVRSPTACTVLRHDASFAEGVNLAGLRWQNWGKASATGEGIEKGFHLPYSWIRVKVTAFRIRLDPCGSERYLYTRVRVTSKYGTKVVRAEDCIGDNE